MLDLSRRCPGFCGDQIGGLAAFSYLPSLYFAGQLDVGLFA